MLGNSGATERSGEPYLPYVGHIGPKTILLEDGSLLAMARVRGVPFELEDHAQRNAKLRALNTLFRNIADDNVAIYSHLVRHPADDMAGAHRFRSHFAEELDAAYRNFVLSGHLFRNSYFISLVLSPRGALGTAAARQMARWRKRPMETGDRLLHELEEVWQILAAGLEGFGVRRLGIYDRNGLAFSEIAEALRMLVTCRRLRVPIVSGHLGASLYTDRIICGRRGFEVRAPGRSQFGTVFAFREYPAKTRPGMLNTLLSVPFPLVLSRPALFSSEIKARRANALLYSLMALRQGSPPEGPGRGARALAWFTRARPGPWDRDATPQALL